MPFKLFQRKTLFSTHFSIRTKVVKLKVELETTETFNHPLFLSRYFHQVISVWRVLSLFFFCLLASFTFSFSFRVPIPHKRMWFFANLYNHILQYLSTREWNNIRRRKFVCRIKCGVEKQAKVENCKERKKKEGKKHTRPRERKVRVEGQTTGRRVKLWGTLEQNEPR